MASHTQASIFTAVMITHKDFYILAIFSRMLGSSYDTPPRPHLAVTVSTASNPRPLCSQIKPKQLVNKASANHKVAAFTLQDEVSRHSPPRIPLPSRAQQVPQEVIISI